MLLVTIGALRYAIPLDTVNPPARVAAADIETLSFPPANLDPPTIYDWQVIAKGDSFCAPPSNTASDVRSFAGAGGCRGPAGIEGALP